jgi:hypothetical protein
VLAVGSLSAAASGPTSAPLFAHTRSMIPYTRAPIPYHADIGG